MDRHLARRHRRSHRACQRPVARCRRERDRVGQRPKRNITYLLARGAVAGTYPTRVTLCARELRADSCENRRRIGIRDE
jgi:hypothetical protein